MSQGANNQHLSADHRQLVRELIHELERLLVGETAALRWLPQVLSAYRLGRARLSDERGDFVPAQLIADTGAWLRLTPREREVLERVVTGHSNHHIADTLDCSSRTVEVHVSRLLEKSNCVSRAELIARTWAQAFEIE